MKISKSDMGISPLISADMKHQGESAVKRGPEITNCDCGAKPAAAETRRLGGFQQTSTPKRAIGLKWMKQDPSTARTLLSGRKVMKIAREPFTEKAALEGAAP